VSGSDPAPSRGRSRSSWVPRIPAAADASCVASTVRRDPFSCRFVRVCRRRRPAGRQSGGGPPASRLPCGPHVRGRRARSLPSPATGGRAPRAAPIGRPRSRWPGPRCGPHGPPARGTGRRGASCQRPAPVDDEAVGAGVGQAGGEQVELAVAADQRPLQWWPRDRRGGADPGHRRERYVRAEGGAGDQAPACRTGGHSGGSRRFRGCIAEAVRRWRRRGRCPAADLAGETPR
jgi:hypothetical protein